MNWKRTAQRFALFIKQFGVEPLVVEAKDYRTIAVALQRQYDELHRQYPDRAAAAKIGAGALIRKVGFEQAAAGLVSVIAMPSQYSGRHYKRSKARLKCFYQLHPEQAVPCPFCRMRCGLRKRAWLTKELAEAARLRDKAGSGQVYECPKHPGYWHVRHR